MDNKSWNEFWGEFLQVTFHKGHPDLWPTRERRALWALKHFQIEPGAKVLNLGCGDGMVDIWLSRMGFKVTAVDRNSRVLDLAKETDDTNKVTFISSDLNKIQFESESFDAVLFLEVSGLMNKKNELELFKKIYSWLKPDGKFILDCPEIVETENPWSKEFPDGVVRGVSKFDESTRVQDIQFYFKPNEEDEFGIYDPYDIEKGDVPGIKRYLYPKNEIMKIFNDEVGFNVQEVDHYYEKNYFGVLGEKNII